MSKQKELFVVSSINPLLGDDKISKYFLTDTDIIFFTKNLSEISIKIAKKNRIKKNDLIQAQEFIEIKYPILLSYLSAKLNQINYVDYDHKFWHKALNFSLKRHITLVYDSFLLFERNFKYNKHRIKILSKKSFHIPNSYENLISFLKGSDFAQEQLFSLYIDCFYPQCDSIETFDEDFEMNLNVPKREGNSFLKNFYFRIISDGFVDILSLFFFKFIVKIFSNKNPKIGIINSFFSLKYISKFAVKSLGNISVINYNPNFKFDYLPINKSARDQLYEFNNSNMDRFEQYFYFALKYLMPKNFIEGFNEVERVNNLFINKHAKLKHLFSEAWISNDYLSTLIAKLQQTGVEHINNEHNFLSHPILGNNVNKIAQLSDRFITIGWQPIGIDNAIKGSSLFDFSVKVKSFKKIKLLYISHFVPSKRTDFFSGYTMFCEDGLKYLSFQDSFFKSLNQNVISSLYYRSYPESEKSKYLVYDETKYLKRHLLKFSKIDNFQFSCKNLMAKSKLIVLSYVSTGLIEALVMNIPVVVFWNKNSLYLKNDYLSFFNLLIEADIIQTDANKAAKFVNSIFDNPELWWKLEKVQNARIKFLEINIGNPSALNEFIFKLNNS